MTVLLTGSKTDWENQIAGYYVNVTSGYGVSSTQLINDQAIPPSISYTSGEVLTVGDGWNTWSGGYTGEVVWPSSSTSITIKLTGEIAFGFEVEPDLYQEESMTITLSNGKTKTEEVGGKAGAKFFGFVGTGITSITITDNAGDSFAIGNFYVQKSIGLDYRLGPNTRHNPQLTEH